MALSLCEIVSIDGATLSVLGLDAIDGSLVVDVKKTIENEIAEVSSQSGCGRSDDHSSRSRPPSVSMNDDKYRLG